MKKVDAVPGTLVRVPDKERGGARQLMLKGGQSLAGVILAYGRYAEEYQGLCGEYIVSEKSFADTCVVVLVQVPFKWDKNKWNTYEDYRRNRLKITPETRWQPRTFSLASVMNHDAWVAVGDARRLLNMEVQALNQRQDVLRREAFDLARPFVSFSRETIPSWEFYLNTMTGKLGFKVNASQEDPAIFMPEAPQEVLDRLAAIEAEQKSILTKLSCPR